MLAAMSARPLFAPARHGRLGGEAWSEARARAALAAIVDDLEQAYRGPEQLWPNHPDDLEGDPDVPLRTLYLGAGGVAWALARLARAGLADPRLDLAGLAVALPEAWRAAPEFTDLYRPPQPSLLMGEAGLLLLADELAPGDSARRDRLGICIEGNERNPTRELLWGSPGTMLAAQAMAERSGEERWASLWRSSAAWLLAEWGADVWEQDLYGRRRFHVGPAHGFAGNAHALLRGRGWLEPDVVAGVEWRTVEILERHALRADGFVQWPALLGESSGHHVRTQWCHGAPGMVIALGGLLAPDPMLDALFAGAGELTWQAGPLRGSASLCHGTAGNGYAFLRLFARTGDEVWLARARAFAMHAAGQVEAGRRALGRGRYSLFTGDAGVALYLGACLSADPGFPVLDG